jgi:hypothetical protein
MTQIVIKKEKPCILTEEFFEAGMFVVETNSKEVFITSFDQDTEKMLIISLKNGDKLGFKNPNYEKFVILEKGTVLEITV